MTTPLFDTHLHLDDEQFDPIRSDVIQRASDAGLVGMVTVGTTRASSEAAIALSARYGIVHAAVGIQPNYCSQTEPGDWDRIIELSKETGVVALGETGLDRYWDHAPFDLQQDYFDRHIRLSQKTDLPFIIHMRDCGEDIVKMLDDAEKRGPLSGIMHSFTGDKDLAERCLALGLHISFAGMVTFKKSHDLRQVAAVVPDDKLLIETDAPYLSPHPFRGQRPNEPGMVAHTALCIANEREMPIEKLGRLTTNNASRLFRIA